MNQIWNPRFSTVLMLWWISLNPSPLEGRRSTDPLLRRNLQNGLQFLVEALKNIEHSMSIRNLIFSVILVLRFHTGFFMTVYYKMWEMLLQNATVILLQNATEVYYNMRQVFYYKMRQLLQNAKILLQKATVITKCDVYYKLRQYTLIPFCVVVIILRSNLF